MYGPSLHAPRFGGRIGYGPSLLWAEFVMGRVRYGLRCPGIVWSTIKVSWVWRCSRNDNVMHNYLSMNVILKFGPCILVTIISVKVIEKIIVTCLKCRSFGLTYSVLTSPTTPKMKNKQTQKTIIIIEKL